VPYARGFFIGENMYYRAQRDNRTFQNERRKSQRARINLAVTYHVEHPPLLSRLFGDSDLEATTIDLSESGMALLTEQFIPIFAKILLKIILYKYDEKGLISYYEPIEISGVVRSSFLSSNDAYRLGVSFTHIHQREDEFSTFMQSTLTN